MKEKISLLVIDDDEMITYAVRSIFEKKGYQVTTAPNGEEGLACLQKGQFHLIILDVVMPKMDGWTLIRKLRASQKHALIPVIFLSSLQESQNRLKGFQLGADDYLAKPFRLEELDFRVQHVLKRFQNLNHQIHPKESAFQGSLEQLGVASLLNVLQMERKTGLLTLEKEGKKAEIFFKEGEIFDAHFPGEGNLQNKEVIYSLLTWDKGSFSFVPQVVDKENNLQTSLVDLLLEGIRRIDEKQKKV